jgi:hypothetical protein
MFYDAAKELMQQYESGLITEVELVCEMIMLAYEIKKPQEGDIDQNTGLKA